MNTLIHTDNTSKFLNLISKHLSSREDCRRVEYVVQIHADGSCSMNPIYSVYRDRFHRKQSDLESVVSHVMKYHFSEYLYENSYLKMKNLTEGTYEYRLYPSLKHRRWVKIN